MKQYHHNFGLFRHQTDIPCHVVAEPDMPQAGFTIIELLIATLVFSMVIMVILYGVLDFTHAYYSGVNSSSTQDTARNIMNTVAQSIEFSGSDITTTPATFPAAGNLVSFCAGGTTYVYSWGVEYNSSTGPSSTNAGLYAITGGCQTLPFAISGGQELLANHMRITDLTVTQSPANARLYTITLGLAYGDGNLLCNASDTNHPGGCLPGATQNTATASVVGNSSYAGGPENDVQCLRITGSQFCAHAGLSTTVSLRVANSALN